MQAWAVIHRNVEAMRFARRHELLPCAALAVMMAGCVLLCSTFKGRRVHCKHERAANASLGSHCNAASKRCASHELLPCVALAVMMAGCVLVCSTFKGRRMHCKHERAANASLGSHSLQRRSDALRMSCCLVLLLQR